jgi:hypothetical protein
VDTVPLDIHVSSINNRSHKDLLRQVRTEFFSIRGGGSGGPAAAAGGPA